MSKLGKRPSWIYRSNVQFPLLRDGSTVADYLADPDVGWANLAVMIGVALGAPVGNVRDFARAIGLHRNSVRPYMTEARVFHRTLFEFKDIEAAVAHSNESAQKVTSSTGPDSQKVTSSLRESAQKVTSSSALMPATAAVTPLKGVNQPAGSSPEQIHHFDPDFALGDPPDTPFATAIGQSTARTKPKPSVRPSSPGKPAAASDTFGFELARRIDSDEALTDEEQRKWGYRVASGAAPKLLALAKSKSEGSLK